MLSAALADRYRIERELGAGGMAVVYLAHDVRHDRKVALKVLRPELSAVIGVERFLTEIRTTANLQHPHILPLHDSGEVNGTVFYVMPFVEGESLRDRLTRDKQLPIADAVRIATEVAEALDYAYRKGIIHRDIKPENILLHDGRALVADFGIALAAATTGGTRLTETGMSLGTPHYMSPEQAMGERDLDGRSDIYALGCVLYEMLAGEPPFTGPTAQAIVAKVMTATPEPVTTYRNTVPPPVAGTVHTALQKLPADRFQSAREFVEALTGQRVVAPSLPAGPAPGRRITWPAAVAAMVGALIVGMVVGRSFGSADVAGGQPMKLRIPTPNLGFNPNRNLEISPDGSAIVYLNADPRSAPRLYTRRLDELDPTPTPGVEGANPSVSRDGRELLFTNFGQTFRVPLAGGQPTLLSSVPEGPYQTISDRGDVVYMGSDGGIWMLRGATGNPVKVSSPDSTIGERRQHLTDVLPGGRQALVYTNAGGGPVGRPYALDLESGNRTYVLDTGVRGVWYAGQHTLVYAALDNAVFGIAFDPKTLATSGEPVVLGGPVAYMPTGVARVSTSTTGTVVFEPQTEAELVYVTRSGTARRLLDRTGEFHNPRFSPDGTRLAVDINDPSGRDVWVLSMEQGTLTRVTFDEDGHDAIWSPNGASLVYMATPPDNATPQVFRAPLDGSGGRLRIPVEVAAPGGWTADGRLIATLFGVAAGNGWDIVSLDSTVEAQPVLNQAFSEAWPAVSPDGRWLAYSSDESHRNEVYLRSLQGNPVRIQISVNGASEPVWDRSGRHLYYRRTTSEQDLIVATLDLTGVEPRVVNREVLFSWAGYENAEPHANFDVDSNGDGFAMIRRMQSAYVILIQNVHELVRRENER